MMELDLAKSSICIDLSYARTDSQVAMLPHRGHVILRFCQ